MPNVPPDSERFVEYVIRLTKGRLRLVQLASAGLTVMTAALIELALVVLADQFVTGGLSAPARRAGRWAMLLTAAGGFLGLVIAPVCRRLNDLYVARLIERAHPEFRNDLTAAVQLRDDPRLHPGIRSALASQAAREVADTDPAAVVRTRRLKAALLTAVGVVLAFTLYALLSPKPVGTSLARVFGRDLPAPSRTQILWAAPEDGALFRLGEPVVFTAELRRPGEAVVVERSRDGGATWPSELVLAMNPTNAAGRVERFARGWTPSAGEEGQTLFRFRSGDASSPARAMEVLPVPAVVEARLMVHWPPYTGRDAEPVAGRRIEAMIGAEIEIDARTNLSASAAALDMPGDDPPLTIDPDDPQHLSGRLAVTGPTSFRLVFRDARDMPSRDPVPYEVHLRFDEPPQVTRSFPVAPEVGLPADGTLQLAGEARDDFGLSAVRVEWRAPLGARGQQDLAVPPGRLHAAVEEAIPVARLGGVGQEVSVWIVARDDSPGGGREGRSDPLLVRIVAPQAPSLAQGPDAAAEADTSPPADARAAEGEGGDGAGSATDPRGGAVASASQPGGNAPGTPGAGEPGAVGNEGTPGLTPSAAAAGPGETGAAAAGQASPAELVEQLRELAQRDDTVLAQLSQQLSPQVSGEPTTGTPGGAGQPSAPADAGAAGDGTPGGEAGRGEPSTGPSPEVHAPAGEQAPAEPDDRASTEPSSSAADSGGQGAAGGEPSESQEPPGSAAEPETPQSDPEAGEDDPDAVSPTGDEGSESTDEEPQDSGSESPSEGEPGDAPGSPEPSGQGGTSQSQGNTDSPSAPSSPAPPSGAASEQSGAASGSSNQGGSGDGSAAPGSQAATGAGSGGQPSSAPAGQGGSPAPGAPSGQAAPSSQTGSPGPQTPSSTAGSPSGAGSTAQAGSAPPSAPAGQPGTASGSPASAANGSASNSDSGGSSAGGGVSPAGQAGAVQTGAGARPDVPLPDAPPGLDLAAIDAGAPAGGMTLEALGRVIDAAQEQIRNDRIDPALLEALGMDDQEFRAFVEPYAQRFEQLERLSAPAGQGGRMVWQPTSPPGQDDVRLGTGRLGNVQGSTALEGEAPEGLSPGQRLRVAPEYREHVEAYLRAVSELPGDATTPAGGP